MKQIFNNFLATLRLYKVSSLLNILGLGVAFASLYLIAIQVNYDMGYNRNIPDYENVYELQFNGAFSQYKYSQHISRPIGRIITEALPGVEKVGIFNPVLENSVYNQNQNSDDIGALTLRRSVITNDMVDILGLEIVEGDIEEFKSDMMANNIIMPLSVAKKFNISVGDDLYRPDREKFQKVVAICQDIEGSGDFSECEVFLNLADQDLDRFEQWNYPHYVKMNSGAEIEMSQEINAKVRQSLTDAGISPEDIDMLLKDITIRLISITDSYFADDMIYRNASCDRATLYTLISIAIAIIVIAFINFVNFFFALVPIRIRAVNARKIFGCSRSELILGFVVESLGLMLCAMVVALILILLAQDSFIVGFISTSILLSDNVSLVTLMCGIVVVITIAIALYPAYYITSFPAAMAIKKGFSSSKVGRILRYTLIGVQFVASMVLLIYTIFTQLQYNYLINYDLGIKKSNVLTTDLPGTLTYDVANRDNYSAKLKENSSILDVAYGEGTLVADYRMSWGRPFGETVYNFSVYPVSNDFLRFMGIDIFEGRDFRLEDEFLTKGTAIFNRAAMEQFGIKVGDTFPGADADAEIVGFCENFNHAHLKNKVTPFAFYVFGQSKWSVPSHVYIRLVPGADLSELIPYIKEQTEAYAQDFGSRYMEFKYFDEELGQSYNVEKQYNSLILLFAMVSIIISLMGVFGLVLFETQFRQQEIVVRRVYGATVPEILLMLNRKFLIIVAICFVVAAPLAYLIVESWLSSFANHVAISPWVFVAVLVAVAAVTISIVTTRSLKAANTNPAELIGKNA